MNNEASANFDPIEVPRDIRMFSSRWYNSIIVLLNKLCDLNVNRKNMTFLVYDSVNYMTI